MVVLTPLRDVHHKRIADITLAYLKLKMSDSVAMQEVHATFLSTLQSADKKFRDIIDQNCPLMYVIDCKEIANIIYSELKETVEEKSGKLKEEVTGVETYQYTYKVGGKATKYISKIENYDESGDLIETIQNDDKDFYNLFMDNVLNDSFIDTVAEKLFETLHRAINTPVYPIFLNITANKLYKDYMSEVLALSAEKSKYVNYATLSVEYATKFKKFIFKGNRAVKLSNPKTVLPAINNQTIVVLADNFTYFRDIYNPKLTQALKDIFKTRGAVVAESDGKKGKPNFSIGEFIDIGHTAAFITGGQPLGVNMPAAQAAFTDLDIYKGQELETQLSKVYADLNLEVTFDRSFSGTGTCFINFGMAIGVVMRKPVNSTLLRTVENRIIAPYKTEAKKVIIQTLNSPEYTEFLIDSIPPAKGSKSLIQFITAAIIEPLRNGKKIKNEITKSIVNKNSNINLAPSIKIGKAIKSKQKNLKATTKVNVVTKKLQKKQAGVSQQPAPLLALQNLLNASLVQRVKQNMGTGGRRDILNLRSGRFAESVRVERLSESRNGAITAFYDYMRYPYATFSRGGDQERPFTRDPKLLIAGSIRQIAEQVTTQRLRAVLV